MGRGWVLREGGPLGGLVAAAGGTRVPLTTSGSSQLDSRSQPTSAKNNARPPGEPLTLMTSSERSGSFLKPLPRID